MVVELFCSLLFIRGTWIYIDDGHFRQGQNVRRSDLKVVTVSWVRKAVSGPLEED